MLNIKKHYKIFISIIIIIVLISTFITYDITRNNITYNNNGEKINVKYFSSGIAPIYIKHNYTASSCYIDNNKLSYMNSTIIKPYVYLYKCLVFGIDIHLNNINNKYLYLDINSKSYPSGYETCLSNLTFINSKYINNVCEIKYKINGNNMFINSITIFHINNYIVDNKYYNTSIKIELNKNFYNLFDINTIKETAIYGTVGLTPGCIVHINGKSYNYDPYLNSSFFMENNNTHNFHIVDIRDGYFYFFAKPYTEYKLYYLNKNNNTLEEFYDVTSIETGSPGSSNPEYICE